MSRFDVIIFGATGYTGKYLVKELATTYENEQLRWAIAGRSMKRLDAVLESVATETNTDLRNIEKFLVDTNDLSTVKNMCDNTKILMNCVGPYRFTGELIVRQCVESKTHHLDVSGEPEFLEKMQLLFDKEARDKNIFIIGSCGFDSVPADLGVIFTQKMFKNDLEYIESYLSVESKEPVHCNYATWESAVYGFAAAKNLSKIRKEIFKFRLAKPKFPAPKRTGLFGYFMDSISKKYCFDFMGSDKSVVQRTQYFNYEFLDQRSVQYMPYFTIQSSFSVLIMILFGINFGIMANFKFGRYLLLKFYRFFSGGFASKLETEKKKIDENARFINQFRGVGHSTKLENKTDTHSEKPDQLIITETSGPEGYKSTALFALDCVMTLLGEQDKIPAKGGVLTPGAAFANTNLIERLIQHGMKFEVIYNGPKNKYN